jgi:hypothetical protein
LVNSNRCLGEMGTATDASQAAKTALFLAGTTRSIPDSVCLLASLSPPEVYLFSTNAPALVERDRVGNGDQH